MSEFLPEAVRAELARANETRGRKKPRRTVKVGGQSFTILKTWDNGFAVDAEEAPKMRGLVDIYEGADHIAQCLVYATAEEAGQMRYEYKRETAHHDGPALDYEKPASVIRGLLTKA